MLPRYLQKGGKSKSFPNRPYENINGHNSEYYNKILTGKNYIVNAESDITSAEDLAAINLEDKLAARNLEEKLTARNLALAFRTSTTGGVIIP